MANSRRCNDVPIHRHNEAGSTDCTVRGLPLRQWALAPTPVENPESPYWQDELTDLFITTESGENFEVA